ncbi:DUF6086 family protein [Nocardia heshunensis]
MSLPFEVDGETVWDPALRTGIVFIGTADALGDMFRGYIDHDDHRHATGLRSRPDGTCAIDPPEFLQFVDRVRDALARTGSLSHRILIEGWLTCALALLDKMGTAFEPRNMREERLAEMIEEVRQGMPQ